MNCFLCGSTSDLWNMKDIGSVLKDFLFQCEPPPPSPTARMCSDCLSRCYPTGLAIGDQYRDCCAANHFKCGTYWQTKKLLSCPLDGRELLGILPFVRHQHNVCRQHYDSLRRDRQRERQDTVDYTPTKRPKVSHRTSRPYKKQHKQTCLPLTCMACACASLFLIFPLSGFPQVWQGDEFSYCS